MCALGSLAEPETRESGSIGQSTTRDIASAWIHHRVTLFDLQEHCEAFASLNYPSCTAVAVTLSFARLSGFVEDDSTASLPVPRSHVPLIILRSIGVWIERTHAIVPETGIGVVGRAQYISL